MRAAAERAGRDPESIVLVAVTKTVPPAMIQAAVQAGIRHIGENRVQEAQAKREELVSGLASVADQIRWHLIGPLQRNKVNAALRLFDVYQSWDRLALVQSFSRKAEESGHTFEGFIQVNIGREQSKHGVDPDGLMPFLQQVNRLPGLRVRGLMCIPPWTEDPEAARPFFRAMRDLHQEAVKAGLLKREAQLSMGMSGDFEVAIEEGADVVRVGRSLFGSRPQEG